MAIEQVTVEGSTLTGSTVGHWGDKPKMTSSENEHNNYKQVNKEPSGKSRVMQLHDYYAQQQVVIETLHDRRW
jgi:hypothetical protein